MGEDLEKFIERYPTYIEALEMLEDKDQRIAELEQELAKLKEKAIVPKFKIGQKVWCIFLTNHFKNVRGIYNLEITDIIKTDYAVYYQGYILKQDKNIGDYWVNEKDTFLTEEEAKAKLKEIKGNE